MIYIAIGIAIGASVGWFSFAFQKTFLGLIAAAGAGYALLFKTVVAPMAMVGGVDTSLTGMFGALPMEIQTAAVVGLFAAFVARIGTWYHARFLKKEKVETPADRRARIYADYGMRDPLA